jgi:hypothetical protein
MNDRMKDNYFIKDWLKTVITTVKLNFPDISTEELTEYLYKVLDCNIKVPIATLDNNYINLRKEVDVLSLIQWVKDNNYITAGNGTIYKNHSQEYNPSIHF